MINEIFLEGKGIHSSENNLPPDRTFRTCLRYLKLCTNITYYNRALIFESYVQTLSTYFVLSMILLPIIFIAYTVVSNPLE